MKKILFIFLVGFFLSVTPIARAQEEASLSAVVDVSATPTPRIYNLAYPGLLPDSPLYFLKVTRDRIVSFLISDPLKRAQFNLLQADKRLGAGMYLIDKKKYDLAESTFSKGLNYMESSLDSLDKTYKEKRDVSLFVLDISASLDKHQELLSSAKNKSSKEFEKKYDQLLAKVAQYKQRVSAYKPK